MCTGTCCTCTCTVAYMSTWSKHIFTIYCITAFQKVSTVNLDIFIVTFRSRRQLRLLILRKHMCTISINVIWSHSYEKYINTKFSHNTIVNVSEYKNFQIHSLSCGFCIVYDATCGPSITVIFPESGLLSLALPHARCWHKVIKCLVR